MDLLFPTIVHDIKVSSFNEVQDDLIKFSYQQKKKDPKGVIKSNIGGWQSAGEYMVSEDNILQDVIISSVSTYFCDTKLFKKEIKVKINSLWININGKNDYNQLHTHPNSDLSGVFWIKTPNDCGKLELRSPGSHYQHQELMSYTDSISESLLFHSAYSYPAVAGLIRLFPSSLDHQVYPNKSNQDRTSASFNVGLY